MKIINRKHFDAIQLKKGNEREVVDFVRNHIAIALCPTIGEHAYLSCVALNQDLRYGDYIAVIDGTVTVVPRTDVLESYDVVEDDEQVEVANAANYIL